MKLSSTLIALGLFGIAFGYVEAAVVVYLRALFEPARQAALAGAKHDEIFPLLLSTGAMAESPRYAQIAITEMGRELATLAMLAAVGLLPGGGLRRWLAGFLIAFGVWDIFYYVFLQLLIGWPGSLWAWDILFLVPLPWVAPVIAPVIVAASMIAGGTMILWREARGRPIPIGGRHWTALIGGAVAIVVAFCWDHRSILAGGMPQEFNWPLFLAGQAIAAAGFLAAACRPASGFRGQRL